VHAIAAAGGRIDHHGLALTPGGSAALAGSRSARAAAARRSLGRAGDLRTAGRPIAAPPRRPRRPVPGPVQRLTLSRKIASPVGVSEFVPVIRHGSNAEPLRWRQPTGSRVMPGRTDLSLSRLASKVMPRLRWSTSSCRAIAAGRKHYDLARHESRRVAGCRLHATVARQEQFLSVAAVTRRKRGFAAISPWRRSVRKPSCSPSVAAGAGARSRRRGGCSRFDRSNVDGFALRAADLEDARPDAPRRLRLNREVLTPGLVPRETVAPAPPRSSLRAA